MSDAEDKNGIGQERHERLCAYVFGELAGAERAAFEAELLRSPELQAERARLAATIGLVKRAIPDEGLPADVRREILASARRGRFRFLRGRTLATVAAAAVLLVGAAAALRWFARDARPFTYGITDNVATATRPESEARRAGGHVLDEGVARPEAVMELKEAPSSAAEALPPADAETLAQVRALGYTRRDQAELPAAAAQELYGLDTPAAEPQVEPLSTLAEGEAAPAAPQASLDTELRFKLTESTDKNAAADEATPLKDEVAGAVLTAELASVGDPSGTSGTDRDEPRAGELDSFAALSKKSSAPGSAGPTAGPASPGSAAGSTPQYASRRAASVGGRGGAGSGPAPAGKTRGLAPLAAGEERQPAFVPATELERTHRAAEPPQEAADGAEGWFLGQTTRQRVPEAASPVDAEAEAQRLLQSARPLAGESPSAMFFRYWGDSPFVATAEDRLSTFAVDVDTASYALARSYLKQGALPPREAVRTEEFVNYFRADQPAPSDGKPFAIGLELAPSPFSSDVRAELLRVTVRGRDVESFQRQPLALTFVIDVSGSMREGGRLELVKRSLSLLLRELYPSDAVGIVAFSNSSREVSPMVSAANRGALEGALLGLAIEGGTNVEAGLRHGYALAAQGLTRNAVNRVILCSDGVGNIGETQGAALLSLVKEQRAQGIYLNTVGVGMGNLNDKVLEELADQGDGLCSYVDSDAEAKRVFVDGLARLVQPIARDVKIQVEFDPEEVESWRQLGYENRALAAEDFRKDEVDAGEVNAGHQVTALYELVRTPRDGGALATVRVRYKPPFPVDRGDADARARAQAEQALEVERALHASAALPSFASASPGFRRSVLVAEFAEVLRRSVHARGDSYATLLAEAQRLGREAGDPDVTEFVALLQAANPLLDGRAKEDTPRVQALLDQLAELHYRRGLRERTHAAVEPAELEREQAEIARLEGEVRAEVFRANGVQPPAAQESQRGLGYSDDDER